MSAAAYLWKLRCLNVHDNKIDVANVGHRQKNFEIQMGGNPIERLGSYPKTHTIGIDAAALFPLDDSSLDNPWPSVRTIHLYGRDATPKERKQVAKWFPKAQLEFIGPVKKGPKIVTKP